MTRVLIAPQSKGGEVGGIARVVEAQRRYLPDYDIELVNQPELADVLALHATNWIAPTSARQRIVSHCHGLYWSGYDWRSKWYGAVNYQVIESMRQADAVTAPSQWVADSIRRGTQLRPLVIEHGIDINEWEPEAHNGYVYWDKSRVDPVCDPRAVNVLAAAMPDTKFLTTFGDHARNVTVLGEQTFEANKNNMRRAGLYLATTRETFGISVLEALACGVPVVGWDWAGQAEIMTGYEVGYLAPLGDYDALVRGIHYCFDNRSRLGSNARQLVESKYQWRQVVSKYADIYKLLHGESERPHPHVSVIMPSYNLGKYLEEAIDSVCNQDYQDWELIVVDDCSTDGSYELAQSKAALESRITTIWTPNNLYLAGALNYGISQARGDYVLALDADNMLAPGTLRVLSEQLDKDRWLDIAYGKVKFVTEDGSPDTSVSGDGISGWPPREFSYDAQMAHRNQIPSTSMYRRSVWQRVGGYRSRCRTAEDADFWCRATSFGATAKRVTDAVTLIYRNRQESMSHQERDWPWEAWYSWASQVHLTPYIASVHREGLQVPIYEPTVSIIVPVGPGHETQGLQDALDSVYSQTYRDWECICVSDLGGADDLVVPSWVRRATTGSRASGTSIARNIGIGLARGEYIVFLDADDYLAPDFLLKCLQAHKRHGGYVYTDWIKPETSESVSIDRFECKDQLHNLHHAITCLYPRDCVDKFDESMRVGEDWDFVLGVQSRGYCGTHVREPLVYYRQTSGSNRRELVAEIDQVRANLQRKWGDKMAGCGCKGGGGIQIDQSMEASQVAMMQASNGELVLLEFTAPDVPTRSWTGPSTGTSYRFGSDVGHKVLYVHRADAYEFLKRPEFRIADIQSGSLAGV